METDSGRLIRLNFYNKILKAWCNPPVTVRKFYMPLTGVINIDCSSLTDMINWKKFIITEPPSLQFILDDVLREYASSDEIIEVPDFLCHSQNTERFVHVVSEYAVAVTDEQRLGHIYIFATDFTWLALCHQGGHRSNTSRNGLWRNLKDSR